MPSASGSFVYDAEDLLLQSGRGVAAGTTCLASVPTGQRVTRTYDAIHRETNVAFPTGTPAITRGYDGNSNVTSATRAGGAAWTYVFDALDNLTQESLSIDARTYVIGHGRTLNGDLATRSNSHSGTTLDYAANAYGQPTRVRVGTTDYIADVDYHPNGLILDADYANGHLLTQSLDGRMKPYVLKTAKAGGPNAVWQTFTYNTEGKVSAVADTADAPNARTYGYDANGRLVSSSGPWGTGGAYVYDALGNVRSIAEGSTTATITYDATNRVSSATINGAARSFSYDARGPFETPPSAASG